jgi:hypothetical protein
LIIGRYKCQLNIDRGQKSEVRSQSSEDRDQSSEDRG